MKGQTVVSTDSRCLIVMYHYVRPLPDSGLPFFRAMTPERFKKQIELLSEEWTFVSLEDYIEGLKNRRKLPQKCCIITFDDGLRDHYEFVLPILSRFGIPGAFFICSRSISESYMLDVHMIQHLVARLPSKDLVERLRRAVRLLAPEDSHRFLSPDPGELDRVYYYEPEPATRWAKYVMNFMLPEVVQREVTLVMFREEFGSEQKFGRRLYLLPEQLTQMVSKGMTIGSHGHEHIAMSYCSPEQKREELTRSRQLIESWVCHPVSSFCYPWGGIQQIDKESEDSLIEQKYHCGLTTLDGVNEGQVSLFYLKRRDCIRVSGGT